MIISQQVFLASAWYVANKHWAAWHRVTPAVRGSGKTKRLRLFSLESHA